MADVRAVDGASVLMLVSPAEAAAIVRALQIVESEYRSAGRPAAGVHDLRARLAATATTMRAAAIAAGISANRVSSGNACSMESAPEWLTVALGSGLLGCTPRRVRQLITDGQLPARRAGRQWLIDRTEIEALKLRRQDGR